ncbi:MAG: hypothetical protein ACRDNG_06510 [Gaiellaceae bacterium]
MNPDDQKEPSVPEPDVPRAEEKSAGRVGEERGGAEDAKMKASPFDPPPMERIDLADDHPPRHLDRD